MPLDERELEQLKLGCEEYGVQFTPTIASAFSLYADLLEEANEKLNLTAIHRKGFVTLHFIDSLAGLPLIKHYKPKMILDIGSGGGFPGIPLAITLPDVHFTLIDGTEKKVFFLTDVVRKLGLSNVSAIHARSETIAKDPKHAGQYEVVLSRAVATLSVVASFMAPFVKEGGAAIAYKGEAVDSELKDLEEVTKSGMEIKGIKRFKLASTSLDRSFVVIERTSKAK